MSLELGYVWLSMWTCLCVNFSFLSLSYSDSYLLTIFLLSWTLIYSYLCICFYKTIISSYNFPNTVNSWIKCQSHISFVIYFSTRVLLFFSSCVFHSIEWLWNQFSPLAALSIRDMLSVERKNSKSTEINMYWMWNSWKIIFTIKSTLMTPWCQMFKYQHLAHQTKMKREKMSRL